MEGFQIWDPSQVLKPLSDLGPLSDFETPKFGFIQLLEGKLIYFAPQAKKIGIWGVPNLGGFKI